MRFFITTTLLLFTAISLTAQGELNSYRFVEQMEFYNVPVVSVSYYRGAELEQFNFGDIPEEGVFPAGSISKVFTAIGVLTLVDSGLVDLDIDINSYLLEWKVPEGLTTHYRDVTPRLLLSHMSGIDDTAKKLLPERVEYYPGLKRRYSWSGYYVLQKLIEDVTGEDFAIYMKREVLDPLSMSKSFYRSSESIVADGVAGHDLFGDPVESLFYENLGAMGLWTNSEDMVEFMRTLSSVLRGSGMGPLSLESTELLLSYQKGGWGLGPSLKFDGENKIYRHSGFSQGFVHNFIARPYRDDGIVIMCSGENAWKIVMEILHSLEDYSSWGL